MPLPAVLAAAATSIAIADARQVGDSQVDLPNAGKGALAWSDRSTRPVRPRGLILDKALAEL